MPTAKIIDILYDLLKNRAELKDQGSRSFHKAELDTRSYLARLRRGGERDFVTEKELAELWTTASIDVGKLDKALADSCRQFAQYWVEPIVPPLEVAEEIRGIISHVDRNGRDKGTIWLDTTR